MRLMPRCWRPRTGRAARQDATGRQDADAYFKVHTIKHKDVGVLKGVVMDADQGEVVGPAKATC